jgi:hypothetical protein
MDDNDSWKRDAPDSAGVPFTFPLFHFPWLCLFFLGFTTPEGIGQ